MSPRQAVLQAGVLIEGHFVFADGRHALNKLEMDNLWNDPAALDCIISLLAKADGLLPADLIMGVPTGGQRLAEAVAAKLGLPLARLERVPGGAKQDFKFVSDEDAALAKKASAIRIYEDVVTSLSSVAGVVKLLDENKRIDALAIWRRGSVKPEYARGLTAHYLVEEELPSFPAADCPVDGTVRFKEAARG